MNIVNAMPYQECDSCEKCLLHVYKHDGTIFVDCKNKDKCFEEDLKGEKKHED